MALKIRLLRPDDLLNLHIECVNLELDTSNPEDPVLVPTQPDQECYLVVTFPPQTIAETAFFETATIPSPPNQPPPTQPDPVPPTSQKPTANAPVAARLGGPSRLVFRIPAGFETRISFSLEGLLNWMNFELSVSPIAATPETPTAQQVASAGTIRPPQPLETAVELPYRLILSPNREASWQHSLHTVTHGGRTELWHTRLVLRGNDGLNIELSRVNPAPLRAIWSPDYNAKAAPPLSQRDLDLGITAMSPYDRHAIVVLTSAFSGYYVDKDTSNYLPSPIHAEQVMLSPLGGWLKSRGNWEPPYKWQPVSVTIRPKPWEQFFRSWLVDRPPGLEFEPAEGEEARISVEARGILEGRGLGERALIGAAIGTAGIGKIHEVFFPGLLGSRELLSLSEWVHIATLGRDHYVRIVYEGHLYPFGHRAALIKVTERQIRNIGGSPLAYLVQHMFIVVREPVKDYTGVSRDRTVTEANPKFANYERYLPFKRVRLTTLITPDIAHPAQEPGHIPGTDFSTWVMVNVGDKQFKDFKFHAVAEDDIDITSNQVEFTASLIFIPLSEPENNRTKIYDDYAKSDRGRRRACIVPEQPLTYAPRDPDHNIKIKTDNTTLITRALYIHSDKGPFNKQYGGFLPTLYKAEVRIPAIEQLLGKETTTTIALTEDYRTNGLINPGGVFAQIVKEVRNGADLPKLEPDTLSVEFQAKQAGGIATPNLGVSCLSRKFGTLAGDINQAAANTFNPSEFFPKGSARLFGVLDLADLIQGELTLDDNAPKIEFVTEDIPGGKKLITRLAWEPKIQDRPFGILEFIAKDTMTDQPSKLTINALIEKIEKPGQLLPAAPVQNKDSTAYFSGALTGFSLNFLNVIELKFRSFNFKSENGKKLEVDVKLDDTKSEDFPPVRFKGDLDFVESLRKLIPPGVLGDGPSLDVDAQRIRAGFAIALPPAAVGVFALKGISLGAFLELPFSDGKPTFDFAFSERHHPFLLTVSLLGGGGFFHLQLDTNGIKQLEAAFEFGAVAALDIGVASGSVHIMAGIYFTMQEKDNVRQAILSGYFRAGGELTVLGIVSVSVEFNLSFIYYGEIYKCKGRATLTVTIEIAFLSKTVELTVEKSFGKEGGDPTFAQLITSPAVWSEYANAYA